MFSSTVNVPKQDEATQIFVLFRSHLDNYSARFMFWRLPINPHERSPMQCHGKVHLPERDVFRKSIQQNSDNHQCHRNNKISSRPFLCEQLARVCSFLIEFQSDDSSNVLQIWDDLSRSHGNSEDPLVPADEVSKRV